MKLIKGLIQLAVGLFKLFIHLLLLPLRMLRGIGGLVGLLKWPILAAGAWLGVKALEERGSDRSPAPNAAA